MKTRFSRFEQLLVAVGIVLLCGVVWGLWPEPGDQRSKGFLPPKAVPMHEKQISLPAEEDGPSGLPAAFAPKASLARQAAAPPPSPAVKVYDELMEHGQLQRQERQMFQAQKWEVDLAKALEVPANVRLERRSGTYSVPDFKYPNVRVDRVYRMDGTVVPAVSGGGSGGTTASSAPGSGSNAAPNAASSLAIATSVSGTPAAAAAPQVGGGGLMDAGGGTAVWENAMVADHVMVQVQPGVTQDQLAAALPASTALLGRVTSRGLYLVSVPMAGDNAIERAVLALGGLQGVVQFAEPDFLTAGADTTPNDPLFTTNASDSTHQWHLPKIMAPRAWDVIDAPKNSTVANETVVAVVDTGVDYNHPDLAANIWTNPHPGSIPGYANDVHGWNFVANNNDPMDDVGHGTHVAGIIGAIGNNGVGTSGVCWGVKILPLRIIQALGNGTYGTYSAAIAALDYIYMLNQTGRQVAVANHSWGGGAYSLAMLNAINNPVTTNSPIPTGLTSTYLTNVNTLTLTGNATQIARVQVGMSVTGTGIPANVLVTIVSGSTITLSDYTTSAGSNAVLTFTNPIRAVPYGVVHVAAAGNSQFNVDRIPIYPACLPSGFILSVGATDVNDAISVWTGGAGSNYGQHNVHLFAPGTSIWSTYWIPSGSTGPTGFIPVPGSTTDGYVNLNGTSMAAPQVTGAIALIRMWQPNLTDVQCRQVVMDQVDQVPALQGVCASGGRLNIAKIIDRLYQPILVGNGGSTGGGGIVTTQALQDALALAGRLVTGASGAGGDTILFLNQGQLWAWGYNNAGQLGSKNYNNSATPLPVPGLSDIVMAAVAASDSFALDANGNVWAWGGTNPNLLGNGASGGQQPVPQQISGLSNIVWISGGGNHVLAVRSDGAVFAWGQNTYGQLGDGTTTTRYAPVQVSGLPSNVIQVKAGYTHSVAVCADGSVYAWGQRSSQTGWGNMIGDGTSNATVNATSPVLVPISNVAYVDATAYTSLFLKTDGTVWQTGIEIVAFTPTSPTYAPTQVSFPTAIKAISGGAGHTIALDANGNLYAWGDNTYGNFGNGSLSGSVTPIEIPIPSGNSIVTCLAANSCTFILDDAGNLYSCGWNNNAKLGIGISPDCAFAIPNPYLTNIAAIGGSSAMRWARQANGTLLMWGYVNAGNLNQFPILYPNPPLTGTVQEIASNNNSFFAHLSNGSLWAWGNNGGILGDGTTTNRPQPVHITALSNVVSVSCGLQHALAACSNGSIYSWGSNNSNGQFGNGTTSGAVTTPTLINGLNSITQVVAANYYSLALRSDGTVWAWGQNDYGQLGDGTTTDRDEPQQVPGLTNITQIAAFNSSSSQASFALRSDGAVFGWGEEGPYFGVQYANSNLLSPTMIYAPSQPQITKIVCMRESIVALLSNQTVIDWGYFGDVLGRAPGTHTDGTTSETPMPVYGASNVVDIASGGTNGTFLLKQDGSVWCFGSGVNLTLGLGTSWSTKFVQIVGFGGSSTTLSTLGTDSTFNSWYFQNFTSSQILDANVVGDTADASGDGIPNLIKYALGLNPLVVNPTSSLPQGWVDTIGGSAQSTSATSGIGLFSVPTVDLTSGQRYPVLTVSRNGIHLDVDYIVEVSTDLVNWQSGDPFTVTVSDTAGTLEVYSAASLDNSPRQFMRLRIQRK